MERRVLGQRSAIGVRHRHQQRSHTAQACTQWPTMRSPGNEVGLNLIPVQTLMCGVMHMCAQGPYMQS
eukprot:6159875-Amphidinium_carterae.1